MSSNETNKSEVARIREQIELECQAIARLFDEPQIMASHAFIHAKYRHLDELQDELVQYVPAEEATAITFQAYERIVG